MVSNSEKRQNTNTYNQSSRYFEQLFSKHGVNKKDIELTFSKINKKNPKTIELGCGTGKDAAHILKFTKDYKGIDISKKLLRVAKTRLSENFFELEDFETYNFPLGIDVVLLLPHCFTQTKTLFQKL